MPHMSCNNLKALGGETCHWCGVILLPTGTINGDGHSHPQAGTRDHIIPRSLGGRNHRENLVLSCYRCNTTRGILSPVEWMLKLATILDEEKNRVG